MKLINQVINQYTTPEQRRYLKHLGSRAYSNLMRTSIGGTIRDAKDFYTSGVKPVIKVIEESNNKSTTRAGLDPSKATELKAAPKGSIFKGDIQQSIINLGRNDEVGAKARQDLVMFLVSIGAPAPEAQLLDRTIAAVAKTKGVQAAINLGKQVVSKVQKATPKQIKNVVSNVISTSRNELVRSNPKANELIKKGTQTLKSKQKEVSDALDAIFGPSIKKYNLKPEFKTKKLSELTEADWKQIEPGYKIASPQEIEQVLGKPSNTISVEEYLNKYESKFTDDQLMNLANFTEKYLSPQKLLKGEKPKLLTNKPTFEDIMKEDFVGEKVLGNLNKEETKIIDKAAKKGIGSLNEKETDTILDMLKSNTKGLEDLAKETGVKSKKEIPDLMKFTNQLGDIIKNSPSYIKSQATGQNLLGLLANTGLSIYDLYQAYKENDGSLLPKSLNNVARLGAGLLPGNPILKIFYGGLGYAAGDQLTKAAFKKLGVKHETSDIINKEIEAGIYQPGLSDEIPEFIEGQSGRKYHVTGNKIFDYATGRPVNIANALKDASDFVQFKTQEAIDKKNALEQQENDLRIAMEQGYNVDPSQLQTIQVQKETAQQEINRNSQLANQLQPIQYDSEGDLVEQYRQNVVAPEQQREQIQAQKTNQDITTAYNLIAEKVAYDSAADIDKLITPQSMLNEYHNHQAKARAGQGYFFSSIDDFVNWKKSQAMIELQPKIREQAASIMTQGIKSQQELNNFLLEAQKVAETYRHNRATEAKDIYNAQTERGYKQGQLDIGQYNAQTGRINAGTGQYEAQTGRMNANTNRAELGIKSYNAETGRMNANTAAKDVARKEQLLPYQQASYAGQTVMNAGMSGLSMDQFLNSNTSVFGTVFPGTQQGQVNNGSVPYTQYKNQINQYYNQQ